MRCLLVAVLLFASSARAATYIVGDDRELVTSSKAIVVGTVIDTYARASQRGVIETVAEVAIEERIKGIAVDRAIRVVHIGGRLGNRWLLEPGAPRYARGDRVLLFLDRTPRGDWTTRALALGSFRFSADASQLARTNEIAGWNADGTPHVEHARVAQTFLDFVRAVVRGEERAVDYEIAPLAREVETQAAFTSGSYTLRFDEDRSLPIRRFGSSLSVSWRIAGTQGGLDFEEGVDFAVARWNGQSPAIDYARSPTPASGDTLGDDGESRVIAGDPHGEVPGDCCAGGSIIASAFVSGTTDVTSTFNGESFFRITHSDVIFNDGVSVSSFGQGRFNTTMAHELGHTLGLRHSDQNNVEGPCAPPLECCTGACAAIMRAAIAGALPSLQPWDRNAIDCLYDGVCAQSCTPPAIVVQPSNRTIAPGETTSLSVVASGTPPLSYRWFVGIVNDTSQPIGESAPTLADLAPATTTSYWVRVNGQCSPSAHSRTVTVTVNCRAPSIVTQPPLLREIRAGQSVKLSVIAEGAEPLTYAWFQGEVGDTSTQVGNAPLFASEPLFRETKFWVRIANGCGSVNSAGSTVKIASARRRSVR